jgi:hypothetical protein
MPVPRHEEEIHRYLRRKESIPQKDGVLRVHLRR